MSYTKLTDPMPGIAAALDNVLLDQHITDKPALRTALLASGITIKLDSGEHVWVACAPNDDPATHQIEVLAVAIAGDADGALVRTNGHHVAALFSRGIAPAIVADLGLDAIRRAMMRVTLGEYPEEDWVALSHAEKAERSIRTMLTAYAQIGAVAGDVL